MSDASRRSALGLLASCVVHSAVVLSVHRHGRASERVPVEPMWMELQVEPPETPLPTSSSIEPTAQPGPAPPRERQRPTRVSPQTAAPVVIAPQPSAAVDTKDALTAPASEQRARAIDLSPLAAARTLGDSTYFPLRDAGAPGRDEVPLSPTAQADALAARVSGLRASKGSGRSVEGAIADGVEDTLYNVLRPWKLLQRTMRGSQYRYTGAGFDAAILPDGRVRFREKGGPSLGMSSTQSRETGPGSLVGPAPTFGLTLGDPRALWYRIRGKDPFAAERRLFLERTRALREHLSGRAAERGTAIEDEENVHAEPQPEPQLAQ